MEIGRIGATQAAVADTWVPQDKTTSGKSSDVIPPVAATPSEGSQTQKTGDDNTGSSQNNSTTTTSAPMSKENAKSMVKENHR